MEKCYVIMRRKNRLFKQQLDNFIRPFWSLWFVSCFLLCVFGSYSIRAQYSQLDNYPHNGSIGGIVGQTFEVSFSQKVYLHNILLGTSNGRQPYDIYMRVGGVESSPGTPPTVDSANGWVFLGQNYVTNNLSNFGGNGTPHPLEIPLKLFLEANVYGFAFVNSNGDYTVPVSSRGPSLPVSVTDGIATISVDTNASYRLDPPVLVGSNNEYMPFAGVLYIPINDVANNISTLSVDLPSTFCNGPVPVKAQLFNHGPTKINTVTVNWRVTNSTGTYLQTPITYTGVVDTIFSTDGPFEEVTLGNYTFAPDEEATIEVWTSMPNGVADPDMSNDSASFTDQAAFAGGVYTINPSGSGGNNFTDFAQVNAFLDSISPQGICGSLVFNIAPGTYVTDLVIPEIIAESSTNAILFDGGDTSLVHLTNSGSAISNATIHLNGADNVTFKNLTISNTKSGDAWGMLIQNASDYITVDSCKFVLPVASTTDRIGVLASSSTSGESTGNNANHIKISNSQFIGGESGIHLRGEGNTNLNLDATLINNSFYFQDDHGLEVYMYDGVEVRSNTIDSMQSTSGDAMMLYNLNNFEVSYNYIIASRYGTRFNNLNNNGEYVPRFPSAIYNNVYLSKSNRALIVQNAHKTHIYHNTAKGVYGLHLTGHEELDMRNNIFYSTGNTTALVGDELKNLDVVDYNLYYNESGGTLISYLGISYTDLAEWKKDALKHNQRSIQGDPFFMATDDLYPLGGFPNGHADVSTNVNNDIELSPRGVSPDIGAYEFDPDTVNCFPVTGFIIDTLSATSAVLSFDKSGDSYQVEWGLCGFTQGTNTIISGVSSVTLNGLTPETCYEVYVRRLCSGTGALTAWGGPFKLYTPCIGPLAAGTYTINPNLPASGTNFTSFTGVADRLRGCGIWGPVVFQVASGTYNEFIKLGEIEGSSAGNTITFDGGTNLPELVYNAADQDAVVDVDGTDWLTIKGLKIINTKTSSGTWGIRFGNESDHLVIEDCVIELDSLNNNDMVGILGNGSKTSSNTAGAYGDDLIINNNIIEGGKYGIYLNGLPLADTGIVISNNEIKHNRLYGVFLTEVSKAEVNHNVVQSAGLRGIELENVTDFHVESNNIEVHTKVQGGGLWGIRIWGGNGSIPATRSTVYNNMINCDGYGLLLQFTQFTDVYHNTAKGRIFSGLLIDAISDMNIVNNNFVGDSIAHAVRSIANAPGQSVLLDYNNYYTSDSALVVLGNNQYADLASFQAAFPSLNVHSVSGDPMFTSATDLHSAGVVLNNKGDSLGILLDIDGDVRSQLFPDIGADEFVLPCTGISTNGMASSITPFGAELSWIGGGGNFFNVQYGQSGFTLGTGSVVKAVPNPYQLGGLLSNTTYEFYVQDSCGTEGVGGWAGPFSFTTGLAPCDSATVLGADTISTIAARLYWSGGTATNWNVEYGPVGFSLGTGTKVVDTQNDTLVLNTLLGSSCYDYYVQDSCGVGYVSNWSGPFTFCTDTCPMAPAGSDSNFTACLSAAGSLDLFNYIGSHMSGGSWFDLTSSGTLSGSTFTPVAIGNYRFLYIVNIPGCRADSSTVQVRVDNTVNAGWNRSITVCDTVSIDLDTLLDANVSSGGIWVDADASGGLSGSSVDFNLVAPLSTYRYWYVVNGGACPNDTATVSVYVNSCDSSVGLAQHLIRGLQVYPNPSNGVLNIVFTASSRNVQLRITDLSGQLVYIKTLGNLNGNYQGNIDMSRLAAGTYLLTVESEGMQEVVRVIKE